ncbi:trans-1,2-dihydrobenzene-1,2-diol dehydrogenase-like [Magallana gigas]|uniref:trans-1,2-dihydrobenzene-1,2-diol dehydrogenase-like n=1 Tax=Magallana gigas TaxID=29159 RepID=UPI003342C13C
MVFNNEKPVKITADASFSDQGVDQNGCITLTYKNGGKAVLVYSTLFEGKNSAIIYGSKGKIEIDDTFWSPVSANLPSGKITNEIPCGPAPNNFPNTGGLRYEADCVKTCLEEGAICGNIQDTAGPIFTKLAWMVHLMIIMHSTALDAESETQVSDAG